MTSWTRGFLLGIQVLFNVFKFFSQVWYVIILSQIHSNQVAKSKSKQELEHDVGEGAKGPLFLKKQSDRVVYIVLTT